MTLLAAYAGTALWIADDRPGIALYGLPIVLLSLLSAVPRWSSPQTNTLLGIGSFVPVCLLSVESWNSLAIVLSAAQLIAITLYALALAERSAYSVGVLHRDAGDDDPLGRREVARAIVARELRRSRRTRSPVSLLLLKGAARLGPSERRELVELLRLEAREFDTVFSASSDELGILCIDTNRSGARRYAERLQATARVGDFSIASFPDDAVTSQGLFDTARQDPDRASRPEPAVLAD